MLRVSVSLMVGGEDAKGTAAPKELREEPPFARPMVVVEDVNTLVVPRALKGAQIFVLVMVVGVDVVRKAALELPGASLVCA